MKSLLLIVVICSVTHLCAAQEDFVLPFSQEQDNDIFPKDEQVLNDENIVPDLLNTIPFTKEPEPSTTEKSSTNNNQNKQGSQFFVKFINDIFQIPLSLLKTVSNLLSSGLESLTSGSSRRNNSKI